MNQITHEIIHQYQPSNTTCSPTALSMLLGHYGIQKSVNDISKEVPQVKNDKGENAGTIGQQLATWCISLGFKVDLYTFDCQIIDQSWASLSKKDLLEKLRARKNGWEVPSLGNLWNAAYAQSYADFIDAGGKLHIQPAVTTELLYRLLETGPVLPCASFSTLYGAPRTRMVGESEDLVDDINGRALNHSIVIYGINKKGEFLVADPWKKPGLHTVNPERMVAAISTAQIECDNLLFQLNKI